MFLRLALAIVSTALSANGYNQLGCCDTLTCDAGHCCVYLESTGPERSPIKAETCCSNNERCTTDGCIDDGACSGLQQSQCLDNGECAWCCTTNQCEKTGNFPSCPESITDPNTECSDPCNTFDTCSDCTSQPLCGWCCETGLCMRGHNIDTTEAPCRGSFLGLATYSNGAIQDSNLKCSECANCKLKVEVVVVSSPDSINVAVVIVPIVAAFVIILVMVISTIIYRNRKAKEARAEAHATARDRIAMAEKLKPSRAKKHGFGERIEGQERNPPQYSQPDYGEDAVDEDFTCIGCYDEVKEVLYLPCKHHCYCRTCAIRHENIHIEKKNRHQQQAEPPTTTLPICSLCRKPVEWMIYTEAVNTPERLRERRNSTPRTPDCNTPDVDDEALEVTVDRAEDDDDDDDDGGNDPF
eukprot:TRINITY_DN12577_c1_g1_i1.p1 TRINITY_DN12577_c1_g1~~TRINITY_DN12577_c1_g1_i1.p1  ORF type:complete len:412 (+),score=80.95 TRINITY_DN12577_c1_g1_i1:76-1311(+)